MNPVRPSCSFTGAKAKKQLKSKVKGQPQGQNRNQNSNSNQTSINSSNEKPIVSRVKDYAGIGTDSTRIYAEQTSFDQITNDSCHQLSEEACNLLTEEVNYKLRHVIHDCLLKSKLQGRETISSQDVDETFSDLNVDKVYGAPSSPTWVPFSDKQEITLHYLDDQEINLIEIAEKHINISQQGEPMLEKGWLPNDNDSEDDAKEYRETFTDYFEGMCEAIISDSEEIRHIALRDISTNTAIGPITNNFYHFAYFLLTKDVTYDRLTMRALHLLEVLENSPLTSMHIYSKQLNLLVWSLLHRLLKTTASEDIVKHMCYVLSLLCLRTPLRNFVINNLDSKIPGASEEMPVPFLNIVYYLGIEGIKKLYLPYLGYFLARVEHENNPGMTEVALAIYGILCRVNLNKAAIYKCHKNVFGYLIVPFFKSNTKNIDIPKKEIDIINMKKRLIKTRRKVDFRCRTPRSIVYRPEDIFETPIKTETTRKPDKTLQIVEGGVRFKISKKKLESPREINEATKVRRETKVTIGKTSLLLSVLKVDSPSYCVDHTMLGCML
ncbi:uncharacterized protein [Euwallacea fornicatus]|uniref:uncharacterized protein isoform X2 n=1 Tax=Euwallacea fornicatus TaxID=995702 RepID=UPI0033904C57